MALIPILPGGFVSIPVLPGGALTLKGNIDASANPNYPAALVGDAYYISVAGKIGGASGVVVNVGDLIVCKTANAGGSQAAVGADWFVLDFSADGFLVAANNLSDVASKQTSLTNLTTGSTQLNHAGLTQPLSTSGFLFDASNNEFSDGLRIGDIIHGSWIQFSDGTLWIGTVNVIDASGNFKWINGQLLTNNGVLQNSQGNAVADAVGKVGNISNGSYFDTDGSIYINGRQTFTADQHYYPESSQPYVDANNLRDTNNNVICFAGYLGALNSGAGNGLRFNLATGNLEDNGGDIYLSSTGAWGGQVIGKAFGGAGDVSGLLKSDGSGNVSAASAGTDFLAPNGSGAALTGITASQVSGVALLPIVTPSSPTTGQTVSAGTTKVDETLYITPAGTLLALTISLPASANSRVGQIVRGFISQIITTLIVNVSGSGTVVGSTPVTSSVNSFFAYQCVSTSGNGTWARIN